MNTYNFLLLILIIFILIQKKNNNNKKKHSGGKKKSLNIYTISVKNNNFGDAVNKKFWKKMYQDNFTNDRRKLHYITTGSIMCKVNNKSIILGTGFISKYGDIGGNNFSSKSNIKHVEPHKVIAVRGPLTRKKLLDFKIDCPKNYGDPLILMPCIYKKYVNIEDNIIGIITHYIDKNNKNYKLLKNNLEKNNYRVKYIDICVGDNYEKLIDEINKCKYIISSSLHGVIMGIVYKKKTIYIEFSNKVIGNSFKFQDFFQSININYKNKNIYNVDIMNNIIDVDYNYLHYTGKKLILLIPFINNKRKQILINNYSNFYNLN